MKENVNHKGITSATRFTLPMVAGFMAKYGLTGIINNAFSRDKGANETLDALKKQPKNTVIHTVLGMRSGTGKSLTFKAFKGLVKLYGIDSGVTDTSEISLSKWNNSGAVFSAGDLIIGYALKGLTVVVLSVKSDTITKDRKNVMADVGLILDYFLNHGTDKGIPDFESELTAHLEALKQSCVIIESKEELVSLLADKEAFKKASLIAVGESVSYEIVLETLIEGNYTVHGEGVFSNEATCLSVSPDIQGLSDAPFKLFNIINDVVKSRGFKRKDVTYLVKVSEIEQLEKFTKAFRGLTDAKA